MNLENNTKDYVGPAQYVGTIFGGFGVIPMFIIISAFLIYFYTNVIGLSAGAVGVIILASKVFDGISDILFGNLIDKSKSKMGVCRPWVIRSAFLVIIAIVCLFTVPPVGNTGKLIYVFVSYNVSQTIIYTLMSVAAMGLPTYMTRDPKKQTLLFSANCIGQGTMAAVVSTITMNIVQKLGGDQKAWVIVAAAYAVFCMVCLLICAAVCKESVEIEKIEEETETVPFLTVIKSILKNKYWFFALGLGLLGAAINIAHLTMGTYYAQYILGDISKVAVLNSAMTIPGILVAVLSFPMLAKMKKKTVMYIAVITELIGSIIVIAAPTNMTVLILSGISIAIGVNLSVPVTNSMLGNVIEYGEWKTGVRTQAALMGANGAGQKIGQGVVTAGISGMLTITGYDGMAAVQTAKAMNGISVLFIYIPIVLAIIALIILYFYDLDKKLPDIMKELDERRGRNR